MFPLVSEYTVEDSHKMEFIPLEEVNTKLVCLFGTCSSLILKG